MGCYSIRVESLLNKLEIKFKTVEINEIRCIWCSCPSSKDFLDIMLSSVIYVGEYTSGEEGI